MTRRTLLQLTAAPITFAAPHFRIPRMESVPEPHDQISFQRDRQEIARFHYAANLNRPFVYPIIGPAGRTLTRMGHPGDPYTHSHHNSVWISYADVNGVDFWSDFLGRSRPSQLHFLAFSLRARTGFRSPYLRSLFASIAE